MFTEPALRGGDSPRTVHSATVLPLAELRAARLRAGEPLRRGTGVRTLLGKATLNLADRRSEREDIGGHELVFMICAHRMPVDAISGDRDLGDPRFESQF